MSKPLAYNPHIDMALLFRRLSVDACFLRKIICTRYTRSTAVRKAKRTTSFTTQASIPAKAPKACTRRGDIYGHTPQPVYSSTRDQGTTHTQLAKVMSFDELFDLAALKHRQLRVFFFYFLLQTFLLVNIIEDREDRPIHNQRFCARSPLSNYTGTTLCSNASSSPSSQTSVMFPARLLLL